MAIKNNRKLLVSFVAISIVCLFVATPSLQRTSTEFSKSIPSYPGTIKSLSMINVMPDQSEFLQIPVTCYKLQIYFQDLENFELKLKAAKEFHKFAGSIIPSLSTSEKKIFPYNSAGKNIRAYFVLKKNGELLYQYGSSKEQLLARFTYKFFENPKLFTLFAVNKSKFATTYSDNKKLQLNFRELDNIGFPSEKNITVVFYQDKDTKFLKPYEKATQFLITQKASSSDGFSSPTSVRTNSAGLSSLPDRNSTSSSKSSSSQTSDITKSSESTTTKSSTMTNLSTSTPQSSIASLNSSAQSSDSFSSNKSSNSSSDCSEENSSQSSKDTCQELYENEQEKGDDESDDIDIPFDSSINFPELPGTLWQDMFQCQGQIGEYGNGNTCGPQAVKFDKCMTQRGWVTKIIGLAAKFKCSREDLCRGGKREYFRYFCHAITLIEPKGHKAIAIDQTNPQLSWDLDLDHDGTADINNSTDQPSDTEQNLDGDNCTREGIVTRETQPNEIKCN